MAPFYEYAAQKLGWNVDVKLLNDLKAKNKESIDT